MLHFVIYPIGTLQCFPSPCLNNGTCAFVGGNDEYWCQCPYGFYGKHCEIECKFSHFSMIELLL